MGFLLHLLSLCLSSVYTHAELVYRCQASMLKGRSGLSCHDSNEAWLQCTNQWDSSVSPSRSAEARSVSASVLPYKHVVGILCELHYYHVSASMWVCTCVVLCACMVSIHTYVMYMCMQLWRLLINFLTIFLVDLHSRTIEDHFQVSSRYSTHETVQWCGIVLYSSIIRWLGIYHVYNQPNCSYSLIVWCINKLIHTL